MLRKFCAHVHFYLRNATERETSRGKQLTHSGQQDSDLMDVTALGSVNVSSY